MRPGEILPAPGDIEVNQGLGVTTIKVENTSDHSIQVTSHYHFFEANKRLRFDRRTAYGKRLDIPAGSGVRWEPGEIREIRLVDLGGRRRVYGYQGLVNGNLTEEQLGRALVEVRDMGFLSGEV